MASTSRSGRIIAWPRIVARRNARLIPPATRPQRVASTAQCLSERETSRIFRNWPTTNTPSVSRALFFAISVNSASNWFEKHLRKEKNAILCTYYEYKFLNIILKFSVSTATALEKLAGGRISLLPSSFTGVEQIISPATTSSANVRPSASLRVSLSSGSTAYLNLHK